VTHDRYLSRAYLPELDGLRAFSILIVISVHMKDRVWEWLGGRLGVTVFFVLSGYLITMLALREERSRGRLNIPAFLVRRAFRLLPLYYFVVGVYCALILGLGMSPERRAALAAALPFYLCYLQEWPFFLGINGEQTFIPLYQTWSLGIEEKFYLVWPFLGFAAWRHSELTRRSGTLLLGVLMMLAPTIAGVKVGQFFYPYSHILVGCLTALLLDSRAWFDRLGWLGSPMAGGFALAALLGLHFTIPHIPREWLDVAHSGYTLLTAVFLVTVLLGDGPAQRLLRLPSLVMIGKLSYGMYLVHMLARNAAEIVARPGSGHFGISAASLLLTCILSVIMAYLLALTIERPGIAIGRRFSASLQGRREELAVGSTGRG